MRDNQGLSGRELREMRRNVSHISHPPSNRFVVSVRIDDVSSDIHFNALFRNALLLVSHLRMLTQSRLQPSVDISTLGHTLLWRIIIHSSTFMVAFQTGPTPSYNDLVNFTTKDNRHVCKCKR